MFPTFPSRAHHFLQSEPECPTFLYIDFTFFFSVLHIFHSQFSLGYIWLLSLIQSYFQSFATILQRESEFRERFLEFFFFHLVCFNTFTIKVYLFHPVFATVQLTLVLDLFRVLNHLASFGLLSPTGESNSSEQCFKCVFFVCLVMSVRSVSFSFLQSASSALVLKHYNRVQTRGFRGVGALWVGLILQGVRFW